MTVESWSPTSITAIVPMGACSGDLVVTNDCGDLSPGFYYESDDATFSTTNIEECDSYEWNGTLYSASGTYTWIGSNAVGCDSTVTLDLTINDSYSLSVDSTILDTDLPFTWNGIEFLDSGTDSATLSTVSGCDSVVTMNVTVTTTVSIIEEPITFETAIDLYPNPVNNELTILFTLKEDTPCTLNLYNTLGQLVFTKSIFKEKGESKELIQLKNLSNGSYHLKVILKNQDLVYWNKILKL